MADSAAEEGVGGDTAERGVKGEGGEGGSEESSEEFSDAGSELASDDDVDPYDDVDPFERYAAVSVSVGNQLVSPTRRYVKTTCNAKLD
jgi:hypothetical protein